MTARHDLLQRADGRAGDFAGDRRIGPYRITGRLGRGALSSVLLAEIEPAQLQRQVSAEVPAKVPAKVAIKVTSPGLGSGEALRRLANERRMLTRLDHPGIVRLLGNGATADGRPYLVLEYVDGLPIDLYCDRHGLSLERRLRLFLELCDAVDHAHQRRVLHRDLKPTNVLVADNGSPKLLDFGIAAHLEPGWNGRLVAAAGTGRRWMTPRHASPEQLQGRPLTPASDVYSLGLLLYELLTGRHPFAVCDHGAQAGSELEALEDAVLHGQPRRPSRVVVTDPGEPAADHEGAAARAEVRGTDPDGLRMALQGNLDVILLTALHRKPTRRYGSIADLRARLASLLETHPLVSRCSTSVLQEVTGGVQLLLPSPAP